MTLHFQYSSRSFERADWGKAKEGDLHMMCLQNGNGREMSKKASEGTQSQIMDHYVSTVNKSILPPGV